MIANRSDLRRSFQRLLRSKRGAAATVVVLMLPVLLGMMAFGMDMGRYAIERNELQTATDAAALAAAQDVSSTGDPINVALSLAHGNLASDYASATTAADVTVGSYSKANGFVPGAGANANAVRVNGVRAPDRNNAFSSIFGMTFISTISVSSVAYKPPNAFYEPPQSTNLDNAAGDYNELYAYCFDYQSGGPAASRRSQETLIANNLPVGQDIVKISGGVIKANPAANPTWPDCRAAGLSLSLRLRNTRHAKSIPTLWAKPGTAPGRTEYNYYTDTVVSNGKEGYNGLVNGSGTPIKILETHVCDTADACDNKSAGFFNPKLKNDGNNHVPTIDSQTCAPGKYVYFGWEDRPPVPGQEGKKTGGTWTDVNWTDSDYNDIAIELKCPKSGKLGDPYVRLVK